MIRVVLASTVLATGCVTFQSGPLPGAPADAKYADLEGVRVRYTDEGSGPAVVLIHGFASSLETWGLVTPSLVKAHRVIALDLKGFGWSDRPEGDYSPQAEAKLVLALLAKLGIPRASFVAHSWGASVALAAALVAPQQVDRLVLYDAWVYDEQVPTFFRLARAPVLGEAMFGAFYDERPDDKLEHAFFNKDAIPLALIDAVEKALERPGTKAAALAAVRAQTFDAWQQDYAKITRPTLLLWGREDEVTLVEFGERLARQMPVSKLVTYPRCGHFPMLEASVDSTRDLVTFLSPGGR